MKRAGLLQSWIAPLPKFSMERLDMLTRTTTETSDLDEKFAATPATPATPATLSASDLAPIRVRHPLKFRLVQVRRVTPVNDALVCITLGGDDLADFVSASFDDHVKVFFPASPDAPLPMPTVGENGKSVFPEPRPLARDFTPRRFDPVAREIDIEFALHEAGPATEWARQAKVGQTIGLGGPRGSMVIPAGYDWYLMIGDETALPAIARRLEELPANTRVAALIEVANPSAHVDFKTATDHHIEWVYRDASAQAEGPLLAALRNFFIPPGIGFVWAAGEASAIRAAREHLCAERGIDKSRIRAASYWRRGDVSFHEALND
jgi:NADPH-dependent ferric siderophore reductase